MPTDCHGDAGGVQGEMDSDMGGVTGRPQCPRARRPRVRVAHKRQCRGGAEAVHEAVPEATDVCETVQRSLGFRPLRGTGAAHKLRQVQSAEAAARAAAPGRRRAAARGGGRHSLRRAPPARAVATPAWWLVLWVTAAARMATSCSEVGRRCRLSARQLCRCRCWSIERARATGERSVTTWRMPPPHKAARAWSQ